MYREAGWFEALVAVSCSDIGTVLPRDTTSHGETIEKYHDGLGRSAHHHVRSPPDDHHRAVRFQKNVVDVTGATLLIPGQTTQRYGRRSMRRQESTHNAPPKNAQKAV